MTASRTRLGASSLLLAVISPVLIGAPACTLDGGHGFATMKSATLTLSFDPGARREPSTGRFVAGGDVRVEARELALDVDALVVDTLEVSGGGAGGTFDPASPPPGYTLCHNGHCHTTDGRLVPYEQVQAELSGVGASTYVPAVTMPVGASIDLLAGAPLALDRFEPSAELGEGTLARIRVIITGLHLVGSVTGGAFGTRVLPFEVDLHFDGAVLSSIAASRVVDRDGPAEVEVLASAILPGSFLDGVDLGALEVDGMVRIASGDSADTVSAAVLGVVLDATIDGEGGAGEEGGDDPAALACAVATEAGEPVAAGPAPDESAPLIAIDGMPRRVSTPGGGTGYVRVSIDAAGETALAVFRDRSALVEIYDALGEPLGVTSAGPPPCADDLHEHFDVDFDEAGTFYLALRSPSEIWMTLVDGEGHGH